MYDIAKYNFGLVPTTQLFLSHSSHYSFLTASFHVSMMIYHKLKCS